MLEDILVARPADGLNDKVSTGKLEVQCRVGSGLCRHEAITSGRTQSDQVCRGCALSLKLPVAKWPICNNVVVGFRARVGMGKSLIFRFIAGRMRLTTDNRPSVARVGHVSTQQRRSQVSIRKAFGL